MDKWLGIGMLVLMGILVSGVFNVVIIIGSGFMDV